MVTLVRAVQKSALLAFLLLEGFSTALPQGDSTTNAISIITSADTSNYSWVSSWAQSTTGLDPSTENAYTIATGSTSSHSTGSSGSNHNITRIVVPIVAAVGLLGVIAACLLLVRVRRQRALRAHRRRSSWMASKKFRWQPDGSAYSEHTDPAEYDQTTGDVKLPPPSPTYPAAYPRVQPPAPAPTHERKTSIL